MERGMLHFRQYVQQTADLENACLRETVCKLIHASADVCILDGVSAGRDVLAVQSGLGLAGTLRAYHAQGTHQWRQSSQPRGLSSDHGSPSAPPQVPASPSPVSHPAALTTAGMQPSLGIAHLTVMVAAVIPVFQADRQYKRLTIWQQNIYSSQHTQQRQVQRPNLS